MALSLALTVIPLALLAIGHVQGRFLEFKEVNAYDPRYEILLKDALAKVGDEGKGTSIKRIFMKTGLKGYSYEITFKNQIDQTCHFGFEDRFFRGIHIESMPWCEA